MSRIRGIRNGTERKAETHISTIACFDKIMIKRLNDEIFKKQAGCRIVNHILYCTSNHMHTEFVSYRLRTSERCIGLCSTHHCVVSNDLQRTGWTPSEVLVKKVWVCVWFELAKTTTTETGIPPPGCEAL